MDYCIIRQENENDAFETLVESTLSSQSARYSRNKNEFRHRKSWFETDQVLFMSSLAKSIEMWIFFLCFYVLVMTFAYFEARL